MIIEGKLAKQEKTLIVLNNKMEAINQYNKQLLNILSDFVFMKIKILTLNWRNDLPKEDAKAIKIFELFGFQAKITA